MNMKKYACTLVHYSCDRVVYGIHMFFICRARSYTNSRSFFQRGKDEKRKRKGSMGGGEALVMEYGGCGHRQHRVDWRGREKSGRDIKKVWETEDIERMGWRWMSEREGGKRIKHCGRDGKRRGRDAAFLVMAQTETAGEDRGMEGIDERGRN